MCSFTSVFEAYSHITSGVTHQGGADFCSGPDEFLNWRPCSANLTPVLSSPPLNTMLSQNVQLSWPFFLPMTHANDFWAPVGVSQQTITADCSKYHILFSEITTEASLVWVKVGKISFNKGGKFSQLWHKLDTVLWCEIQIGGLDNITIYLNDNLSQYATLNHNTSTMQIY